MALSLYLDECIPPVLETHLRNLDLNSHYINFIAHASRSVRGASDAEQLMRASKSRVFITINIGDFVWLHRQWKTLHAWQLLPHTHKGILAAPATLSIDTLARVIYDFLSQQPSPVLENNMYIYKQGKWQPHPW